MARWVAERRVERLLEGFGMPRGRRRELVIQNCMTRAVAGWRDAPAADLGALAVEQIEDALGRWFAFVLGAESLDDQSPLLVGRAAFGICAAGQRWPGALLTYDHVPQGFIDAMRAAAVRPTPAELPGAMLEQALEAWSLRDLVRSLGRSSRGLPAAPAA